MAKEKKIFSLCYYNFKNMINVEKIGLIIDYH